MNIFRRLDIGCGSDPKGNVNLDLYPEYTIHRGFKTKIDTKKTRNFVKGDSLHLPFKNKAFSIVYSKNVIEHTDNPIQFIRECMRVANKEVELSLPHRYDRRGLNLRQAKAHKHYFSMKWIKEALKEYYTEIECFWIPKPHRLFPLIMIPSTIRVKIHI